MRPFERAINRPIAVDLLAPLCRTLEAAIRATHDVDLGTVVVKAVLHLQIDSSTERVEAKGWVVGHDGGRPDRRRWDQVPINTVGKRLVDAHAILINGEPL